MKKLIFILIVGSLFMGCIGFNQWLTMQNLSQSSKVKAGMTTDEVRDIMGEPIVSELDRNVEEWHYCSTGRKDRFLAIFFVDNKLVAKKFYFSKDMAWDECQSSVKKGDYKVPSEVQAILDKNTLSSPELKEPKEPIEPEEGVMPIVPKVEIPNQPKPPKTEEDE